MSLPGRITDFQALAEVQSQPFDDEFDNIVNILSGVTQDKSIRIRNNDNSFAVARFDQLGTNDIVEFYKSGSEVLAIANSGQIVSSVATGTAPITVASTTKCTNLNADRLDDFEGSDFARLTNHGSGWSASWYYDLPPSAVETTESQGRLIVPENNGFQTVHIKVVYSGGTHTGGTVLTWTIKRRNAAGVAQADLGTISLNDTNNTIHVLYNINAVIALTEGDQIYPLLTTRTGTPTETGITIALDGNHKLYAVS